VVGRRLGLLEALGKLALATAIAVFGTSGCAQTFADPPDTSASSTSGFKTTGTAAEPEPGIMIGKNEMVMPANMQITAETPVGTITITAGQGFDRCYTWEGATGCIELTRDVERWLGRLGANAPGNPYLWRVHNGINRIVADEGQQHFSSVDELRSWLRLFTAGYGQPFEEPLVYRDDGLMVGWAKVPARYQLAVDVWQIYINGRKPDKLPGSQNDKISVRMVSALPHDDLSKWLYLF